MSEHECIADRRGGCGSAIEHEPHDFLSSDGEGTTYFHCRGWSERAW